MYENKLEINLPTTPFCCCATDVCIADRVFTYYFDKPPFRVGVCCFCIPFTCCGPPVIYVHNPACCGGIGDIASCFGQTIFAAPCNVYGLKCCLCFGAPCYTCCSFPLLSGVKNGEKFASAMKYAVGGYAKRHQLPPDEMAIFERVQDDLFDLGSAKGLQELKMVRE